MKHITNSSKPSAIAIAILISSFSLSGCSSLGAGYPGQKNASAGATTYQGLRDENRIRRHIYAGVGIGPSWMQPDTSRAAFSNVNDRVEAGGQVTLGMDLSRQLALEFHSADLGSAGVTPSSRVNYHIHGASALLYAGKNRHNFKRRGLSGYGRAGLGLLNNSVDGPIELVQDNRVHMLIGAGVEYMTRIGLGIRAEAISFEEDARYAQLGLVYRTGRQQSRKAVEIVKAPEPKPEPTPTPIIPIPVPAVVVAQKPEPIDTCSEFSGSLDGVNFHSDSDQLTDSARAVLDGVASRLSECDSVPVQITAHTDSVGAKAYNQSLSERRAASVASYLRQQGITGDRLQTEAFGETQPIDTNATREGRSRNRRVELITLQ